MADSRTFNLIISNPVQQVSAQIRDGGLWVDTEVPLAEVVNRLTAQFVALGELVQLQSQAVNQIVSDLPKSGNARAQDQLRTFIERNENSILAVASDITQLTAIVNNKANISALNALVGRVSVAENTITAEAQKLVNLTAEVGMKAAASALESLRARVVAAEGTITSEAAKLVALTAEVGMKATASALESLSTTVTEQGNTLTAEAQKIINLTAELNNLNVPTTASITAIARAEVEGLEQSLSSLIAFRVQAGSAVAKLELVAISDATGTRSTAIMTGDFQSDNYAPRGGTVAAVAASVELLGLTFTHDTPGTGGNGYSISIQSRRSSDSAVEVVVTSNAMTIYLSDTATSGNVDFARADIVTVVNASTAPLTALGSGNLSVDFSFSDVITEQVFNTVAGSEADSSSRPGEKLRSLGRDFTTLDSVFGIYAGTGAILVYDSGFFHANNSFTWTPEFVATGTMTLRQASGSTIVFNPTSTTDRTQTFTDDFYDSLSTGEAVTITFSFTTGNKWPTPTGFNVSTSRNLTPYLTTRWDAIVGADRMEIEFRKQGTNTVYSTSTDISSGKTGSAWTIGHLSPRPSTNDWATGIIWEARCRVGATTGMAASDWTSWESGAIS